MKWMRPTAFLLLAIAACTTVVFVVALKPTGIGAFAFFAAWLLSPYAIMSAALIFLRPRLSVHWYIVAILVSAGGIVFLADAIFWSSDAQGAFVVLLTPLLQAGALILLLPVAWWLSRNARAAGQTP